MSNVDRDAPLRTSIFGLVALMAGLVCGSMVFVHCHPYSSRFIYTLLLLFFSLVCFVNVFLAVLISIHLLSDLFDSSLRPR